MQITVAAAGEAQLTGVTKKRKTITRTIEQRQGILLPKQHFNQQCEVGNNEAQRDRLRLEAECWSVMEEASANPTLNIEDGLVHYTKANQILV